MTRRVALRAALALLLVAACELFRGATWPALEDRLPGTTWTVHPGDPDGAGFGEPSLRFTGMVDGILATACGELGVHGEGDTDGEAVFFEVAPVPADCAPDARATTMRLVGDLERVESWTIEGADVIYLRPVDVTDPPILRLKLAAP